MNLKTKSHGKMNKCFNLVLIEQLLRRRKDRGASYEEISDFLEDKFQEKVSRLNLQNALFSETKLPLLMFWDTDFIF